MFDVCTAQRYNTGPQNRAVYTGAGTRVHSDRSIAIWSGVYVGWRPWAGYVSLRRVSGGETQWREENSR